METILNTDELLKLITDTADEFKAMDILVLEVTEVCDFADYFVIMSATSTTQASSISEALHFRAKRSGRTTISEEGTSAGEWSLLDFGDIVVHVFLPQKRAYYNLEELWSEAKIISRSNEE